MDLIVTDRTSSGGVRGELTLVGIADRITARDLIRTRVREEVARHNAEPAPVFHGLVQPTDSEATLNGYDLRSRRLLDWEEQADAAERAFSRNGFILLVDDRQVESLDEVLELTADSDVAFLRLVPIVGG